MWSNSERTVRAGKLDQAEETFKKLVLAQPNHSDGFNGLGLVYEKRQDRPKAELFLREAVRKAEHMVQDSSMDIEPFNRIRADLDRVLKT